MENIVERMRSITLSSIDCKKKLIDDDQLFQILENVTSEVIRAFENNKKVLFCGNGGSAADAQHLAAELSGRFCLDRAPLNSEALHVNTSYVTAVANDYSFDEIFSRAVEGRAKAGDILFGISTSGNSSNIINAVKAANKIGALTVGFTGNKGGLLYELCNYCIRVPSDNVARIQEVHIMLGHIMCEIVEEVLFPIDE